MLVEDNHVSGVGGQSELQVGDLSAVRFGNDSQGACLRLQGIEIRGKSNAGQIELGVAMPIGVAMVAHALGAQRQHRRPDQ
jgi:hypothetical protein